MAKLNKTLRYFASPKCVDYSVVSMPPPATRLRIGALARLLDHLRRASPSRHSTGIPDSPQYAPASCPQTAPVVSASSPKFTARSTASQSPWWIT